MCDYLVLCDSKGIIVRCSIRGIGLGLLALTSCASPAAISATPETNNRGTVVILAVRPVAAGDVEYVVRTDGGAVLAIVQPATQGLATGGQAVLTRGERTTLAGR
jgi:hypothetical protein